MDDIQKIIDDTYRFWRKDVPDVPPTAKELGYAAYRQEVKLDANPYQDGTPEYADWYQGWLDADFDNPGLD